MKTMTLFNIGNRNNAKVHLQEPHSMSPRDIPTNRRVILFFTFVGIYINVLHILLDNIHPLGGYLEHIFHGLTLISYIVLGIYSTRLIERVRESERLLLDDFGRGVFFTSKDVRNKLILIYQSIALHEMRKLSFEDMLSIIRLNIKEAMGMLDDLLFDDKVIPLLHPD